jgi:MinD-like ATPase involved in chromosome partitioning or flagellar assembly
MVARIIVIMSRKGGVGKTTVSANLASALATKKSRVLLIDANMETSHIAVHYGLDDYEMALQDVLNGIVQVDRAIYHTRYGLDILPSRVFRKKGDKAANYQLINLFFHIGRVVNSYDFVIIDTRPATDIDFIRLIPNAEIVVVVNPDLTSLLEAKELAKELRENAIKLLGIIVNRSNRRKQKLAENAVLSMGGDVIGTISEDDKLTDALNSGMPVTHLNSRSRASKEFLKLADTIRRGI